MKRLLASIAALFLCTTVFAQTETFTNPLLPGGADPYAFYKDGFYYYTHTTGNRIIIKKTDNLARLKDAEQVTAYTPPTGTMYSKNLWAPEILFLEGKWYIYFAADNGRNENHRMYALENSSADPMKGTWTFKGKVADATDKWAIDGDVFKWKGQLYMIWSGWEGDTNGQQNIYLAKMKNPWTITGKRVKIGEPTYDWEKHGDLNAKDDVPHVNVNEGPQALEHNGRLFIVFSASGCWTDYYALGVMSLSGKNLTDAKSWKKSPQPYFKQNKENGVYAPGHNSFFKSPDGKQDWILYHANDEPGQGCGRHRSPRMQQFTWDKNGFPVFGEPVKRGVVLPIPTGN
ncbi:glycoside hydrolase family 43 protein [Chitinophaga horti]|uniref:Glycoside hydrolase family 43 protein n=1 Tax=Chitinophaga horti TaxID=2920382 RepID=A0ABY6J5S5_9BACT|nr:glycoside hydrolase family 43 protein [Chitinophaga horti]UYQ95025.1 glycoside hydrolase family 43 protein [Chitinophaga horti]